MIGIEELAKRLVREIPNAPPADEAILTLADFLIVLREVEYTPVDGSLSKQDFDEVFRPFLNTLAETLHEQVASQPLKASPEIMDFWRQVLDECR